MANGNEKPEAIRWCRIRGAGLHPATHARTGLCDLHHAEYTAAYSKWSTATARDKSAGRTPQPWEEREREIEYTPVTEVWTGLSPEDRGTLRAQELRLIGAAAALKPYVVDVDRFLGVPAEEIQALIGNLLQVSAEVSLALQRFTSEPGTRSKRALDTD